MLGWLWTAFLLLPAQPALGRCGCPPVWTPSHTPTELEEDAQVRVTQIRDRNKYRAWVTFSNGATYCFPSYTVGYDFRSGDPARIVKGPLPPLTNDELAALIQAWEEHDHEEDHEHPASQAEALGGAAAASTETTKDLLHSAPAVLRPGDPAWRVDRLSGLGGDPAREDPPWLRLKGSSDEGAGSISWLWVLLLALLAGAAHRYPSSLWLALASALRRRRKEKRDFGPIDI